MVAKLLAILCLIASSYAIEDTMQMVQQAKLQWPMYKQKFNLTFSEEYEEQRRFNIYANNYALVERHNRRFKAGLETYDMELNQFSYLTQEEFNLMNGFPPEGITDTNKHLYGQFDDDEGMDASGEPFYTEHMNLTTPSSFDWRSRGKVSPVKNQGRCGSCWAFASIATIESQYAIKHGRILDLSEEELVDCVPRRYYCKGCGGGNPYMAMKWTVDRRVGIEDEAHYRYVGRQQACRYNRRYVKTNVRALSQGRSASFNQLKTICYQRGPVAIFVNANNNFMHYRSGVFTGYCPNYSINHLVTMTGFQGNAYRIKNSWGTAWGERGFIRVGRGRCGIENHQWVVPTIA